MSQKLANGKVDKPRSVNSANGYGLVNEAKAVAWSAGYYPYALSKVADLGELNWNDNLVKAPEA